MMVLKGNHFMKAGWKKTLHLKIKFFLGKLMYVAFLPWDKYRLLLFPCSSKLAILTELINNVNKFNKAVQSVAVLLTSQLRHIFSVQCNIDRYIFENFQLNWFCGDLRNNLAIKSTCCSTIGPKFSYQHPCQVAHNHLSPAPGDSIASSGFCWHLNILVYTCKYMHINISKIKFYNDFAIY